MREMPPGNGVRAAPAERVASPTPKRWRLTSPMPHGVDASWDGQARADVPNEDGGWRGTPAGTEGPRYTDRASVT
jgi:hypothetical protein